MPPIKISDVKKHLSTHDRNGRSLLRLQSLPEAPAIAEVSSQHATSMEHSDGSATVLADTVFKSASD